MTQKRNPSLAPLTFVKLLGVSVRTLQDWEQGRREPSGAAKMLIATADRKSFGKLPLNDPSDGGLVILEKRP